MGWKQAAKADFKTGIALTGVQNDTSTPFSFA
jgi:hypothetical protein